MISAPGCWSAGQITAPPRLEDIGTRVTIVVRRDVPETDNVVLIKVPAPPTLTVSPPATTTAAGRAARTGLTSPCLTTPTWRRYTATRADSCAAGEGARLTPGADTAATAVRRTWTAVMDTSVSAPALTGGVWTSTSALTTGSLEPPWHTVARTPPAPTATAPSPAPATRDTRTSRATWDAAT